MNKKQRKKYLNRHVPCAHLETVIQDFGGEVDLCKKFDHIVCFCAVYAKGACCCYKPECTLQVFKERKRKYVKYQKSIVK